MASWDVRWSGDAELDLDDIVAYIAADSPTNALGVLERLHARARKLESFPERGRHIPEIPSGVEPSLRELIEAPWRIIYTIEGGVVLVVAVVDSRRNVGAWLTQRFGIELPHSDTSAASGKKKNLP